MGRISQRLKHMGFNAKERAYVYAGGIIGAAAPILATRYLILREVDQGDWKGEAFAWAYSLLLNATPMIFKPHLPASAYTMGAGVVAGTMTAIHSRGKRIEKKQLENISVS